jgi:SPASM domain peptide maturase of grasp-with-spasm system
MSQQQGVFKLYANCMPVKGARRSVICDLQKQRLRFIPNQLFYILTELADSSTVEIKKKFDGQREQLIDDYFALLVAEDYGFWCDEPEKFPALDLTWERPETITNSIIDIDRFSQHDYSQIFTQLDELGCQAVQVRAYDALSMKELEEILQACHYRRLRHVDLIIKFQPELTREVLTEFCLRYQVITSISVYSSPQKSKHEVYPLPVFVRFYTHPVTPDSCGEVSHGYFSLFLEHFTEAQQFNTCLNKKLSISSDGSIKSCPSMSQSFGNISDTSLKSVVNEPALIQIGSITKDQVKICRDCEFRYVCTDCRAYTCDSDDPYSKPAKCSYDPYTASWGHAVALTGPLQ